MGRPDVRLPVEGLPAFERFVQFMRAHDNVWSKVSGASDCR